MLNQLIYFNRAVAASEASAPVGRPSQTEDTLVFKTLKEKCKSSRDQSQNVFSLLDILSSV